jgi:hypothetical protein
LTDDTTITQQFIDALAALERERDLEPITGLFGPDSNIGNIVSPREFSGPDGLAPSGRRIGRAFGDVSSTFRTVIVSASVTAAPTWSGRRPERAPMGHPSPMRA